MSSSPLTELEKYLQTTSWYHVSDLVDWAAQYGIMVDTKDIWNLSGQPREGVIDTLWIEDYLFDEGVVEPRVLSFLNLCRDNGITSLPIWW